MAVALLALAAAAGFGMSSVLEQRAASRISPEHNLRLGLVARLIRRPMWLAGVACEGVADLFQAAALGMGALIVVQPILVTGLLVALPVNARWNRQRLGPQEWLGAIAVTAGLALFLTTGAPTSGHDGASTARWIVGSIPILALAAVAVTIAQRTRGTWRPALLATAAGALAGLTDALVKAAVAGLDHGVVSELTSWKPYAAAAAAVLVMVLSQSAYQAGPLAASLPALTAAEPLAAAALGVTLFGEALASGPLALTAEAAGAALMLAGVVALARSPIVCGERKPGYRVAGDATGELCDQPTVVATVSAG